jgi:hypothetical protein
MKSYSIQSTVIQGEYRNVNSLSSLGHTTLLLANVVSEKVLATIFAHNNSLSVHDCTKINLQAEGIYMALLNYQEQ